MSVECACCHNFSNDSIIEDTAYQRGRYLSTRFQNFIAYDFVYMVAPLSAILSFYENKWLCECCRKILELDFINRLPENELPLYIQNNLIYEGSYALVKRRLKKELPNDPHRDASPHGPGES